MKLTPAQLKALNAMPVTLTPMGCLPVGAPHGGTMRALAARGLIRRDGDRWIRADAAGRRAG